MKIIENIYKIKLKNGKKKTGMIIIKEINIKYQKEKNMV